MMNPNQAHYVVVTAIIIKDGKYLIAKRADHEKVFPNKWTVPGGKLERDDYEKRDTDTGDHWYNVFETLVRREVDEEVGLSRCGDRYKIISYRPGQDICGVILLSRLG